MSWQNAIKDIDNFWATNTLRFVTRQEAVDHANYLKLNWFTVKDIAVMESTDSPNYKFVNNQLHRLSHEVGPAMDAEITRELNNTPKSLIK